MLLVKGGVDRNTVRHGEYRRRESGYRTGADWQWYFWHGCAACQSLTQVVLMRALLGGLPLLVMAPASASGRAAQTGCARDTTPCISNHNTDDQQQSEKPSHFPHGNTDDGRRLLPVSCCRGARWMFA